jgi:hypothetical protein
MPYVGGQFGSRHLQCALPFSEANTYTVPMPAPSLKIAILGWGSLLWDDRPEFKSFNDRLNGWNNDGPTLRLEFARVSESRDNALTLVLVEEPAGAPCTVAHALINRKLLEDAICDVRCREGANLADIGYCVVNDPQDSRGYDTAVVNAIRAWAAEKEFDAVVWTDLRSNFPEKSKPKAEFSVLAAVAHIQHLDPKGKSKAAEYVWRAPVFVQTPLRTVLQAEPWFQPLPLCAPGAAAEPVPQAPPQCR